MSPAGEPRTSEVLADGTALDGPPSLRRRALRASLLTLTGVAGRGGLRLLNNVIMARLLFPEAFGVMALVQIFVQGVQLFTDVGIGPSIIQSRRSEDRRFLDTAFTMQVLRGAVIWCVLLLVAWPAAAFYAEPQLLQLIPVVGLSALIAGFESTARFTLNKQLALGRLTAMELGSQLAGIPVMIAWALLSPSVWALVAGSVATAAVRMVWSHALSRDSRDRLRWDPDAAREVIHFGKWIFATTAVGFLATQFDRLVLGKLIPFELLGVYTIAFMLHRIPDDLVGVLGYRVLFPAISQRADLARAALREVLRRNRQPLLAGLAAVTAGLACVGDLVVQLFYDERYRAAGWMLQVLALGLWPRMLANTMGPALLALGQPRYIAYAGFVRLVCLAVGVPAGYALGDMRGVVVAVALASSTDYFIESVGLRREGLWLARQDLLLTAAWLALLAVGAALRHALGLPIGWGAA